MIESLIRVKPVTREDFGLLVEAASKDNGHGVIDPTDVLWKNGERVGFLSIAARPTVWAWLSTKDFNARDTVAMFNYMEGVVGRFGNHGVYVPVPKNSPVHPHMEKLGYVNGGNYDFFYKTI